MRNKVIFHIDVDSFYVAAETWLRPELKDKDVAISKKKAKSVVCALSYSAKEKGAKVPMKLYEVQKFCPNIIVIEPNHNLYEKLSRKIYLLLKKYSIKIEIGSIDEWYLDVTHLMNKYSNPRDLALVIQKNILKKWNITVSIGISYNKFLAKISTDLNKPFGITITEKEDIPKNIWPLPIDKYIGIGKSLSTKLKSINILTIEDLAKVNGNKKILLKEILKNKLDQYIDNANGNNYFDDVDFNKKYYSQSSIGHQVTFENNYLIDLDLIYKNLKKITMQVLDIANRRNLIAQGISITIKYANKAIFSTSTTIKNNSNTFEALFLIVTQLFNNYWNDKPILMLGVSLFNLTNIYTYKYQSSLFDNNLNNNYVNKQNNQIVDIINEVNYKIKKDNLLLLKDFKNGAKNE